MAGACRSLKTLLAIAATMAHIACAGAAAPSPLATPNLSDYTFTLNGAPADTTRIDLAGVDSRGNVYLSGTFNAIDGVAVPGLARIRSDGALDTSWIPALPGPGIAVQRFLREDPAGRIVFYHSDLKLYRIDPVDGSAVQHLALAQCTDAVRTIAIDPVNADVYAACYSMSGGFPGDYNDAHVYRLAGATGLQDTAFDVTLSGSSDCNAGFFGNHAMVFALAHDGRGHLYIGGNFLGQGSAASIPTIVRVATPSVAVDLFWRPFRAPAPPPAVAAPSSQAKLTCFPTPSTNPYVSSILLAPGDVAYVSGYYATADAAYYLARFSTVGSGFRDRTWAPAVNAGIAAHALDLLRNRLYVSGTLTDASGNSRKQGVIGTLPGAVLDAAWDPQPDVSPIRSFVDNDRNRLVVGGDFTTFGTVSRNRVAGLPLAGVSVMAHYYQGILARAPDPSGVGFWSAEIMRLTTQGVSANEVYMAMANFFFTSPEFASTPLTDAQFVDRLYLTFLDRAADPGGRDYWTGQIAAGLTREMVMYAFMFSAEFNAYMSANLPSSMTPSPDAAVVMDFYRGALARLPDDAGLSFWVNRFVYARCSGAGDPVALSYQAAIGISDAFFNGAEYASASATSAQYVSDLYNAFLRRSADAIGFDFWVSRLDSGAVSRETVRKAFIDSPEFAQRIRALAASSCSAP